MKKRFRFRAVLKLSLIATLVLIVAVSVAAQNGHSVVDSGFCGAPGNEESVTWTLYDDGCCVISGTGDIAEFPPRIGYVSYSQTPWAGDATSITVEEGVTGISPYLFSYTSLIERIDLPSTVVTIGEHAFDNCTGLKSLTVPNGITELDDYIFTGCNSLETIKLPQSITSIGTCCFQRCYALKRIEIPENVTELGSNAFEECKLLESITIPQGVTKIGERAFYDCEALAEIIIPDSVTFVGNEAFENTYWIKNRPDGPVYAGKVFYSAEFITQADADLIIKPGTTQISELAGRENRILQTLSIPGSVTVMGQAAF
ncbi:MAG: leucine-rich repeat domain-containing protein [Clostridia bacterium]|nr:leucine-rich repeat domain-containing protein [Clostridia bacterium]